MTRVDAAGDALNATSQGLVSSSAVSAGIARQVAWQKPVRRFMHMHHRPGGTTCGGCPL